MKFVSKEKSIYSYDDYKAILDLIYMDDIAMGVEDKKKEYKECEAKLKKYFVSFKG